jgi:purine-nucleoside phosphorylase
MIKPSTLGIVAGSGLDLSSLFDDIEEVRPFRDFPQLPVPAVVGHNGQFIVGTVCGFPVVLQCGRIHLYEGWPLATVQAPVDIMADFGVNTMILTNAAGGLRPEMKPGQLMAIGSVFVWPCGRWPDAPETIDTDFTLPGCENAGVYMWFHGPAYETRSEIRTMHDLGGGAVGMSAGPELQRCKDHQMDTAAIACITNSCHEEKALTHDDVVHVASDASARIVQLVRDWISEGQQHHVTKTGPRKKPAP